MAGDYNPEGQTPESASPTGGVAQKSLLEKWGDWIDQPSNRAALMQFGIAMLQPVKGGEGGLLGHAANSLGEAGEAAGRVQEQARRETETESKADLREAAARTAEERARYAGENNALRASALGQGLDIKRGQLENAQLRTQLNDQNRRTMADIAMTRAYQQYVQEAEKNNLVAETPQPIMDKQTWMKANGLAEDPTGLVTGPGQKPSLMELMKKNPQHWETIKQGTRSKDKKIRAQAAKAIEHLRGTVSDPGMIDKALEE